MNSLINRYEVIGHLGGEPEVRHLDGGAKLASFSVATTEKWKNKAGEQHSHTQWHNVVTFNPNLVEIIEKYIHKGDKVMVSGMFQTRQYDDKEGNKRTVAEMVANQVLMLGGNKQATEDQDLPI